MTSAGWVARRRRHLTSARVPSGTIRKLTSRSEGSIRNEHLPYSPSRSKTAGLRRANRRTASVSAGLYSLIKGDPEAERLRQLHAEHQQGQERALQQMEDFARDLADGFANNMTAIVDAESAAFFDGLNAQLEDLHNCFSEKEQSNTKKLELVLAVRQLAAGA